MFRRFVFVLLVMAFVLPTFAVIFAQEGEEVTLRWRTRPDNQAEIDLYQSISDSVDEAWEGVALQYEPGSSEGAGYQGTLLNELAAGTAPDVFWIPGASVATFAQEGVILNLADLAMGMEDFDVNVFYPQQSEQLTFNPETGDNTALWGLPRDASAMVLYYNADLFDEAGVDYPEVQMANGTWDWTAFQETSEAIAALSAGDRTVYGFGMNSWWANWLLWINAAGGSYFNEDQSGCGLETEGTAQAIEFLQGLYAGGSAVPFGQDAEIPFMAGSSGMFMNGRWATPNVISQAGFNWNVAEVPAAPGGEASNWLFWGAYVVNANTEHPAEAFELLTRLTSADVQGQVTALGANIPSRNTPESQEAFLNSLLDLKPDLNNAAWINGLQYAVAEAPLWTANFDAINGVVDPLITDAITGVIAPADFASTVCTAMEPFFMEMEMTPEATPSS
ncbi:MAG: sugar ABC transporter substrate-binding protein [Anaerolineae bacterium]|jgi:multiple sugar transport system substrate-binding protein|nr:sugar ABC transporter substrate-binding protein [Anaerolineae bacterium]